VITVDLPNFIEKGPKESSTRNTQKKGPMKPGLREFGQTQQKTLKSLSTLQLHSQIALQFYTLYRPFNMKFQSSLFYNAKSKFKKS
jgi:hypothetical protein